MYICNECGEVIERLPIITEHHPYGDGTVEEKIPDYDCPCGGTYVEANRCAQCGDWFDPEQAEDDEICYHCQRLALVPLEMFCRGYSVPIRAFLNRYFEGVEVF